MTDLAYKLAVKHDPPYSNDLAHKFELPLATDLEHEAQLLLGWHEGKLALFSQQSGPVFIDFVAGKLAHRRQFGGGKKQPLARAVGLSSKRLPLRLIDATAGMGRDSFVLAALGCEVTMIEQCAVVAGLLEDALERARLDPDTSAIAERLSIIRADACDYLDKLAAPAADVIYLDPMYPATRKTAAVKKDMQVLHTLIGPDQNSQTLLELALSKARHRVVVKRPKQAKAIADRPVSTTISSPNTRYDIYTIKAFK